MMLPNTMNIQLLTVTESGRLLMAGAVVYTEIDLRVRVSLFLD